MITRNPLTFAAIILSLVVSSWARRIIDCERCGIEHKIRSPALGVDISSDYLQVSDRISYQVPVLTVDRRTAAIKNVDGTLVPLAKVPASDELLMLMQEWAKDPTTLSSDNDRSIIDPMDQRSLISDVEILYKPLKALIDQSSARLPGPDLHYQYYGVSLPPFVHERHFGSARQAARMVGLTAIDTGVVAHSDSDTHMMYNAMYCLYHEHPHNPFCDTGEPLGVFYSLVIDYSSSFLTVTWHLTYGPLSQRKGGFAEASLGASSARDRPYWAAMEERFTLLLHSISRNRSKVSGDAGPYSNQLIFLGEFGADDFLRSFLHDAFAGTSFGFDKIVIHDSLDPVFTSASSTAGVTKAIMDAPEPYLCDQPHHCLELRERIYDEAKAKNNVKCEL